ncbi:LPS-assembly protein [Rhodobacter viridis]|uniref:LPS-assembly protein LptD n=1 Tax=Rhodobacter viridis TaxID=1054202 RepID=A0A318TXM2_9RHOB|nr:LPS assembly protein LptD [Rhodobacter viridis]PYF09736.1 LPS-assembly protein [Rhodobacter viridis]
MMRNRSLRHWALGTALALTLASPALAQIPAGQTVAAPPEPAAPQLYSDAATLLADRIEVTGSNRLIAEGNVEVYWHEHRLTAARIVYDKATDRLTIDGPIRMVEPGATGSVILADAAELSRDLQNGVLTGARMVLSRELQLAANRIERQDGTRTVLHEVVASSCQVCITDPEPLWEIRARTITHDTTTRQLLFESAQFRAMGVPLVWLPRLRMPDPTVERMSGVLRPSLRTTSLLGPGLKVPYFLTFGPSADLTVTPYFSANYTRTLGLRYRQALDAGTIEVEGALSRDSIREGETRGYVFGTGTFALPADFTLGVQLRMVSDPSYLLNYDITEDDRLWSGVTLERVRRDELIDAKIGNTHSLRDDESNTTEPMQSADASWTKVFRPGLIGGELSFEGSLHTHWRASNSSLDGADADDAADGRDMTRISGVADWRRNWLLGGGVLAALEGELAVDATAVRQDQDYAGETLRALPSLGVELRWPWVKSEGRAAQVIEPVAQIIWSGKSRKYLPDEDSLLTEFDEGNLFDFSRYPGGDVRERGTRANLGLSWTRHDASGWSLGLTAGRVFRLDDIEDFAKGSGLSGTTSDWLVATHLTTAGGLVLSNRALVANDLSFDRDELRLAYLGDRAQVAAGYLWMLETDAIPKTSELLFESDWQLRRGWSTNFDTRYDLIADRAAKAALGLQYSNECVTVDLSLSRRFTSSTSVEPETDFGLSIALAGFGAGSGGNRAERVCRR